MNTKNAIVIVVGLVAVALVIGYIISKQDTPDLPDLQEKFVVVEYAVCQNDGYSKEHCLKRPHPGVGLTQINQVGTVRPGSTGNYSVFPSSGLNRSVM